MDARGKLTAGECHRNTPTEPSPPASLPCEKEAARPVLGSGLEGAGSGTPEQPILARLAEGRLQPFQAALPPLLVPGLRLDAREELVADHNLGGPSPHETCENGPPDGIRQGSKR